MSEPIFVYACFLKPGHHTYVIQNGKDLEYEGKWFQHNLMALHREEDIPPCNFTHIINIDVKEDPLKKKIVRKFDMMYSAFRDFRLDTH